MTRSAGVVSAGVMVSRVLGLVREQVLAYLFPAKVGLDAFYAAFRIPNLLRDMFGEGALSKAFVTTLSEIEAKEGRAASMRVANIVFNALGITVSALALLGILYADVIVDVVFGGVGFDTALPADQSYGLGTKRDLTVLLTQIMFPFLLLVSLAALVMAILNAGGRFFVPAMASSFFNIGSIVVGVVGYVIAPRLGYHPTVGMAVGVLAGGVLQLAWQLPSLASLGFRFRPDFSFRDPWLSKAARLFGPGALMASTVQVNVLVNSFFASHGEGWLAWLTQSYRVLHLPLGLVSVAVSIATLPALSRAAAERNNERFLQTFSYATRLVILFTVPATVGLLVLAPPIVRLIFEQGRFGPEDTTQVASALRYYALGLLSFGAIKIVTDGFYAIRDVRAPMMVSLAGMGSNAALNWLFVVVLGWDHRGLALATSTTTTLSLVVLWLLFRRRSRLGRLDGRRSVATLIKTLAASMVMGAAALLTHQLLDGLFGHAALLPRIAQVLGAISIAVLVYILGCMILRVRELKEVAAALAPAAFGWR
ncbi:MAG TPA: murein biosynthesis integral membrane protein MurJ [Vicinamibacteria bacterium]|nr:murein biosynthesis integral membrane protein MurJ [Vicinamibacteria bacterium]